ncbi:hypothetical protein N7471_005279 [Penicillium samsonianum]|uniref:uncharacterized protein n=1 Tax=Penicillium samsonianum TaxID=1882272 RepID=UPI002546F66E|nr:uncharacterized protein N7471_005279 [Penicillium samsonianum]KAJ6138793.1 hypothetical protein N7471_005279 [Penicillium samsonianum]
MAANETGQRGLPTKLPFREVISVINMGLRMTPEASQRYADLWKKLAACGAPSDQLNLVMAIVTLASLHSSFAKNPLASALVKTYIKSNHISGLRAVLPRLPEELAAVVPNLIERSSEAILMLPALPSEFYEIFSLSANDETALRCALLRLDPIWKPAISLSDEDVNILIGNLPTLPSNLSGISKIEVPEYSILAKDYPELSDQFRIVWRVGTYENWFAAYNAISFFEGLTKFAGAIQTIQRKESQAIYWEFYLHFLQTVVAGRIVQV